MLATRADKNGYCYPSYKRIAHDTGLSVSTVQRVLKKIPPDELEIVENGGSPKHGVRRPTKYRIVIRNHSQIDHSRQPRAKRKNSNDCTKIDHSDCSQSDRDYGQNAHSDCSQLDHLTAKAEQNKEQQRLTDHHVTTSADRSSSPTPITSENKASVLSHKGKAKKRPSAQPWELSAEDIDDLQERFLRLDVKSLIRPAAAKCREKYPDGGPMHRPFLEAYLKKCESDLDPPGFIEGQRFKAEEMKPSSALNGFVQTVISHVQPPDGELARFTPVRPPPRRCPTIPKLRSESTITDSQAQLENWKTKCPERASDFERVMGELKAQSEWDANAANAYEKRCGEIYDRYLRPTTA